MSLNPKLIDFMDSSETMDFITRQSEYFLPFFVNNPNIVWAPALTGGYEIGYVNRKYSEEVTRNLGSSYANAVPLVCGLLDSESLDASGISQVQQQRYLNLKGQGVLIGFVDTGIDYTQSIFKHENGVSKIQYIYDQTAKGDIPEGFLFGAEYANSQINRALRTDDPYGVVQERDTVGHGNYLA